MSEENLQKQINLYREVAEANPGVDVNLLMASALQAENSVRSGPLKSYKWPYTVSLGLPPLGLIYTVKYYISGDEQDRRAGKICALLTVISIILVVVTARLFFSSAGVSSQQLQQLGNPAEIQQLQQLTQ